MSQVYKVAEKDPNPKIIGYFKDHTIALAYAGPQVNGNQVKVRLDWVLTDSIVGYALVFKSPVKFFDDEEEG